MGTVAERLIASMFAEAKSNLFGFGEFKSDGCKGCPFMSAIAEGLIGGQTATTPVVIAGF
jgi:hypothetical protein